MKIVSIVAAENGIRTQNSKVHPSPNAISRSSGVWAISPLTASCNMTTEDSDHNHTEEETTPIEEKDSNLLCTELVVHIDDIFDVIKNGYEATNISFSSVSGEINGVYCFLLFI